MNENLVENLLEVTLLKEDNFLKHKNQFKQGPNFCRLFLNHLS